MRILLSIVCLLSVTDLFAQTKKIAITIDDLPCTNCQDLGATLEVNTKLLKALHDYKIPAIGFVNESKFYTDGSPDPAKITILKNWLAGGLVLGNHTFSHVSIDNTTIEEYENEIVKGGIITGPLMQAHGKKLTYFRHPQLRTGPTLEYKTQLDRILSRYHYTTAPVTIDNDEYLYAFCYKKAKEQKDSVGMRLIAYDYLTYMKKIVRHYEALSIDVLGYNVNHILLLHANELNADYIGSVFSVLLKEGYSFISLDEALTDKAYQLEDGYHKKGISWINRWQLTKGKEITPQPNVSDKVRAGMTLYPNGSPKLDMQTLDGTSMDIQNILSNIKKFSQYYIAKDYDKLAQSYTAKGKIFPDGAGIIEGTEAIKERWTVPKNQSVVRHTITPVEIKVTGDTAYDYGYYEGETVFESGRSSSWIGKYVIVWKKEQGNWKIYLDIWNSI